MKSQGSINDIEQKRILKSILNTEIEMLQTLDRKKLEANKIGNKKRVEIFFEEISKPKKWRNSYGRFNSIVTPFTTRAKELNELFKKIHDFTLGIVGLLGRKIGFIDGRQKSGRVET